MKTNSIHSPGLSDELKALFAKTPKITERDLSDLAKAAQELEADPAFQAELTKGLFVERVLEALEERGESQSDLAKRLGKSRQYLSKLLNEDKRVNFTIETMCEITHHLGRRLEILVLHPGEMALVAPVIPADWTISNDSGRHKEVQIPAILRDDRRLSAFEQDTDDESTSLSIQHESACLAA